MITSQSLHSILSSYGDAIELNYKFSDSALEELRALTTWEDTINNKQAINFNGPIDILGTNSSHKHDKGQDYNKNMHDCPTTKEFFDKFDSLAKCRAFKLGKGSYFAPHRDAWRYNEQFRIVVFLNKTEIDKWMFYLEDKFVQFKPGVPYILNTRKVHGSFSFSDDIYHIIMSVFLTKENMDVIMKMIPNYSES